MAIKNSALEPGMPVTVVMFDDDERLIAQRILTRQAAARILGKTTSAAKCPALIEDRRAGNQLDGISFYTLALEDGPSDHDIFGVGIVRFAAGGGAERIDLDGNDTADSFTACRTFHGVNFAAWEGRPRSGALLWKAYYYTGKGDEERGCASDPSLQQPSGPTGSPVTARIGWVDTCLAIKNATLQPGTALTIVTADSNADPNAERVLKRRIAGKILGKANSPQTCPPLIEDRRSVNESEGFSFYSIAPDGGMPEDGIFGIAVVGVEATDADHLNLDGGEVDSFTVCESFEGIHFSAWSGAPHEDRPVWDAYYLSVDTEGADCPLSFSDSQHAGPPDLWPPEFRIGWVHGCLGIHDTVLAGTPVTIVEFGANRSRVGRRVTGKVLDKTNSGADCPDLAESVRDWNRRSDIGFYKLALEDNRSLGPDALGIAIIRTGAANDPIDLDENGTADSFSICSTEDGLGYAVWPGVVNEGEPLWTASSYLGYDPQGVPECLDGIIPGAARSAPSPPPGRGLWPR